MPLNALASFSFTNAYASFNSIDIIGVYSDGIRVGTLIYDLKKIHEGRYMAARVKTLVDCDDRKSKIVDFRYYANLKDAQVARINSESMPVPGTDWATPEKTSVMEKFVAFVCSVNSLDLGSDPNRGLSEEPESLFHRWFRENWPFN